MFISKVFYNYLELFCVVVFRALLKVNIENTGPIGLVELPPAPPRALFIHVDIFSFQKSTDLYEGENVNLVFRLTHPRIEALVFSAETEAVRDKWATALKDAVNLDNSAST